jgi:uncharacterized protein (UPF0332 family)
VSTDEIRELVRYRVSQARTALADAKCLLEGSGSAMGVISLFDSEFVRPGHFDTSLSKDLHRAFELRQAYDYRSTEPPSREEAEGAWHRAARFVEAIAAHLDVGV